MTGLGLVFILVYNIKMNFIKTNWQRIVSITYVVFVPIISFAQNDNVPPCDPAGGKICNPLQTTSTIPVLIHNVLIAALQIGIPIVALAIIYSGFLFVFARGNSEKLTKAKDTLLYTLIGAAILLGAWAIALMIQSTITSLAS